MLLLFVSVFQACPGSDPAPVVPDEGLLPPGRACSSDEECESNYCVDLLAGQACAAICTGDCPGSLVCKKMDGRDPQSDAICVAPTATLCSECFNDSDCGLFGDLCLPRDGSNFCAMDCTKTNFCPEGFVCEGVQDGAGVELSRQCIPVAGSCSCNELSAGMERNCQNSREVGTCFGIEVCDANLGWTACDAQVPTIELCDFKDNDCDDLLDEDSNGDPLALSCGYGAEPRRPECEGQRICTQGTYSDCTLPPPPDDELVCDGLDDNCNGEVDDGFINTADHCGSCNNVCPPGTGHEDTTIRSCSGSCAPIQCRVPYFDVNASDADGCEVKDDLGPAGQSNSTWQTAFAVGDGTVNCTDGDKETSTGLRIPSDTRVHVPTAPPSPNVDFYYVSINDTISCATDTHICLVFSDQSAAEKQAGVQACISRPVTENNFNEAPVFLPVDCATLDPIDSANFVNFYMDNGGDEIFYIRVTASGMPFGGTYSIGVYDGDGSTVNCPL